MKNLYICMVGAMLASSGCVGITREKFMKAQAPSVERSADMSLSQIKGEKPLFGYKSKGTLLKDDVAVEFLSDPHYAKMSCFGVILPITANHERVEAEGRDGRFKREE